MVEVKCDRWTYKYFQNDFCSAIEVNLETQGDNDLCCLTFENYDPKITRATQGGNKKWINSG